ncbi:hypothetical protein F7725_003468, partial [Dissostichus mawsoni]
MLLNVKRFRNETQKFGAVSKGDGPTDIRSTLETLMTLFPRKLFNDSLPQIHHNDKTLVDKELNKLREQGELLMFQLGFDADAFGLVFASDYKAKVLAGEDGRATRATVETFLEKLPSPCTELSFSKDKMLKEFRFTDSEITQLVKSGVLTVRDAGSWWLSIPNSGKFTKYFIQELEERRTTSHVKFQMKYHIHDIVGAELVE